MKLFDILKQQQGLFANDIRMRINNGQININGNVVKVYQFILNIFGQINRKNQILMLLSALMLLLVLMLLSLLQSLLSLSLLA